jgi:hypothetical protein
MILLSARWAVAFTAQLRGQPSGRLPAADQARLWVRQSVER